MITFNYLLEQTRLYKKSIIIANILAVVMTLISVPIPLFIPHLIDEVILGKGGDFTSIVNQFIEVSSPKYYILIVFILIITLYAINAFLGVVRNAYLNKTTENIRLNMRRKLLTHLKSVSMSEFDILGSGATSSKMGTDIGVVIDFLSSSMGNILVSILKLIGISAILLYLNWKLALVILILNPLVVKLFIKVFKKLSQLMKDRNRTIASFNNSLVESLELFNQIRVQNREEHFFDKVNSDATKIRDKSYEYDLEWNKSLVVARLLMSYSSTLFQMLAIYFVLLGDMSIGEMMAIFVYAGMIRQPINLLLRFTQKYHDAKEAMDRLNDILKLKKEQSFKMQINPFKGKETASIELKNISFAYDENKQIFKDFSLKIEAGEKVAIIGETGSGKSTLANIVMGLYPIDKGEILYNGVDIRKIGYEKVRENIGFVLQAPLMFNATLRYNLSLGKEYSDEEMYRVLKIAQLYEFVDELPNKLDTIVGKNGTKLSGGQRQRLSIARVLLDRPKVIIFDESTSSLDNETENRLLEALDEYIKNKTIITIAHRQTTIDTAERVVNLNNLQI